MNLGCGVDINGGAYASSGGGGGASGGFDPATLGTDVDIDASGYVASTSTIAVTNAANARSLTTKSDSTIYYFEIDADFGVFSQAYIGICNANHSNATRVGYSPDSAGLYQNGVVYSNSSVAGVNGFLNYSDPCVIRVWFKPSTGEVWFGKDTRVIGDPENGLTPFTTINTGDIGAAVTPWRITSTYTLNATFKELTHSALGATPLED